MFVKQMIRKNDGRRETLKFVDATSQKVLHETTRICRGTPIGTVVAVPLKGTNGYAVGWSLCNFDSGEKWNRKEGERIALDRALGAEPTPPVPQNALLKRTIKRVQARAQKVFGA